MKIIYKYEIHLQCHNSTEGGAVSMPSGSEIIEAGFQGNKLYLWAVVNPDMKMTDHYFHVFGTGQQIDYLGGKLRYVGQARLPGLEYFIFERVDQDDERSGQFYIG